MKFKLSPLVTRNLPYRNQIEFQAQDLIEQAVEGCLVHDRTGDHRLPCRLADNGQPLEPAIPPPSGLPSTRISTIVRGSFIPQAPCLISKTKQVPIIQEPCECQCCKRHQRIVDARYRARYHTSMIENLEFIRDHGVESFLEKEEEKWRCPECGGTICCHNGLCLNCDLDTLVQNKKYRWGEQ